MSSASETGVPSESCQKLDVCLGNAGFRPARPELIKSMIRCPAAVELNKSEACRSDNNSREPAGKRNGRKNTRKLQASRISSQKADELDFGRFIWPA